MGIFKSKKMQNLVIFMEPSPDAYDISLKGGNMILNRFCIDEDAAFELSGVNNLKKWSSQIRNFKIPMVDIPMFKDENRELKLKRDQKGTEL